jgi:hypothetical protein
MTRYDKCECGDTFGKHDDNGVCRVKTCDCIEFRLSRSKTPEDLVVVRTSYGGE